MTNNIYINNMLDQVFGRSIADLVGVDVPSNVPPANVVNHIDRDIITLAAPGLQKSDFKIVLEKSKIKIQVKRDQQEVDGDIKRKEFDYSDFQRVFKLSPKIDVNMITASYEKGVLMVNMPYKTEADNVGNMNIEIL